MEYPNLPFDKQARAGLDYLEVHNRTVMTLIVMFLTIPLYFLSLGVGFILEYREKYHG